MSSHRPLLLRLENLSIHTPRAVTFKQNSLYDHLTDLFPISIATMRNIKIPSNPNDGFMNVNILEYESRREEWWEKNPFALHL